MNFPGIPLLDVLRERMSWLSARQNVLSQNVANGDTPGYTAHDLKPLDFEQVLKQSAQTTHGGLTVTDPRHIAISTDASSSFEDTQEPGDPSNASENTVSVEEEMMKVADTQAQYQAATNLYSKAIGMMRTAIDKSGS
jgi:flagellar basal-body rod protein FlgB